MSLYRAAVLGCGGRGRSHASGYAAAPNVEIVACADPVKENAVNLSEKYGVKKMYSDYRLLLEEHRPEIVSVCTWPHLHREMVEAAVAAGAKAIHCEKPMAPTFGDSKAMIEACDAAGVAITFCHQRRFAPEFRTARDLVRDGAVGEIDRIVGVCSNLYDWGTHWFDMMGFFNGDRRASWAMGQIDVTFDRKVFGVPVETSGLSHVAWENDVWGLLVTGNHPETPKLSKLVAQEGFVVYGTEGRVEVAVLHGPKLRVRRYGKPDLEPELPPRRDETELSILNLLDCLESGEEPELSGRKALQATELIFATYESSRRRARIRLPLDIEDSPLISGLEQGFWKPIAG